MHACESAVQTGRTIGAYARADEDSAERLSVETLKGSREDLESGELEGEGEWERWRELIT